ncbi:uncharacterized protein B0H18DRAFT_547792 [Fomitopsis serialis]|uniref:uncharacterized protein n=1 Tax=Fomitopsis serialis TaxID=139415 RepID=UPI002007FF90|nr:uncharacterized protein B0H18DRAFT_547792 [Neoantrodia serialis]KAH9934219.1 hypothetical protein B0H18DRAFT_547792 [Neoantrodia serialis]
MDAILRATTRPPHDCRPANIQSFLSTVGKLEQFAPHRQQETSGRIVMQRLDLFPPIIINPFDVLAERISGSGWTLQQVASTHHMVHLGRPLFAAMYDAGNDKFQETIVNFAKIKLLCSQDEPVLLTEAQSLACIGIRIPLEFKACVPADLENERILVAKHLRLLLYAGRGFAGVITSCPSEPLLAEAAYMVLATRRWSNGEAVEHPREEKSVFLEPMDALSYHIGHSHLDLGTRGETVAAILLLAARDRATTFPLADGELPPGTDNIGDNENRRYDGAQKRRIVTVTQFLRALLAEPYHDITPAEYHRPEYSQMRLEAAFNNCFIYFNHFVKAHKFDMVNQTYLQAAISRGMAFICAENQGGIDIIIPCLFGTELVREKVSAIMIQVKNDRRFKAKVDPTLFACMDPYRCGVFKSGVKEPPPVLRMVFALASGKSSVEARSRGHHPSTRSTQTAKFTAYDIWCAGARQSTFGVIQQGEEDALDNLLTILRGPHDIERLFKDVNVVRILQPGLSTGHGHFEQWFDLEDDMVDEEFEVSEPEDAVAGAE